MFDDRLVKINCGEFEGTTETADSRQLFLQAIKSGDKGTESFIEFMKRCSNFCNMIVEDHIGKNVLIATHAVKSFISVKKTFTFITLSGVNPAGAKTLCSYSRFIKEPKICVYNTILDSFTIKYLLF
ncbi:histidine phosphatase family protein [Desulfosporosinus sp. PR]|uniref:histidine phosphatase family protein n=1 Tax=Candidatus Desulfosporosinus nitrosoreducens TaxID=3401928 RepID=UPI0027EF5D36|nr:histidine phosphatase family protein [Desulfosporosinus sp. PR]MDQ7093586.1 histidine phosphatase family protein [Desulfosporosinus sp. PR]